MKSILISLLVLLAGVSIQSQVNIKDVLNKIRPQGPVELSDSLQMALLVEQTLQMYGDSFNYYKEFKSGKYKFNIRDNKQNEYWIEIISDTKKSIKINVKKFQSPLGGYVLYIDNKEIEKLIAFHNTNFGFTSQLNSTISIIERNTMLIDKEILPIEELQPDERRILDKEFTTDNFQDQYNNDLELYKLCQAGKMFPYPDGHSKIITIDNEYSSFIYFDQDFAIIEDSTINKTYGYFGDDAGEFMNPMGFCVGRMYTKGNNDIYPIYIADMNNLRIRGVNFVANTTSSQWGVFDNKSFYDVAVITYPYDIGFFLNGTDSSADKLWVTQVHPTQNFLTCLSKSGSEIQKFTGYKDSDNGMTYFFEPGSLTRLSVYNNGFACLCFIDNIRNCLVSCLLDENGLGNVEFIDGRNNYIKANEVITFPSGYVINSVSFQKTPLAHGQWPSLWVTSPSYIHHLKINKSGNIQYLASTSLPRNSLEYFTNMRNTICTDNVYDIYSIENWSMSRGLRKYYPFCDIHSEVLENYCNDSLDIMKFKATFTNDCWLYMTASRKNRAGNWESVKIRKLNGSTIDTTFAIKWQFAGWNQSSADLFIDLQLDLPIEDYVLGDSVALSIRMYPEYSNPANYFNNDHIDNVYKGYVSKACLPRSGGCPFIYFKDANTDYYAENNILHKSEYSGSSDITDRYKLIKTPLISGSKLQIALVENENDNSYINMVKLYAVDYPSDRKVSITENNYIVLYDSSTVVASDSVMLNSSTNITSSVNFHNPGIGTPINRYKLDSIYAHFSYSGLYKKRDPKKINNKSNSEYKKSFIDITNEKTMGPGGPQPTIAFIADIGNLIYPITSAKDTGGVLSATSIYSNTATKMFGRRENNSVVVLPLFYDSNKVDNLAIKWQSDFHLNYIGVATLEYSGYEFNEIPMDGANYVTATLDSEITSSLSAIDTTYGLVNASGLIKLDFDLSGLPSIPSHYLRTYVIDINGHYTSPSDNTFDKKESNIPLTYNLSQNYPNPFNPITKINYELPKNTNVKIVIYDILGREIVSLVKNEFKQAGRYTVEFNGQNYASGVYFYRIEAGDFVLAKKMVLVK